MWMLLKDDTQERKIAIFNQSSLVQPIQKIHNTTFEYQKNYFPEEHYANFLQQSKYYAAIWIPEDIMEKAEFSIYSFSRLPMDLKNGIALQLQNHIEEIKTSAVLAESQIPDIEKKLAAVHTPVKIKTLKISEESGVAKESSSEITSILSVLSGCIIYFFIFMYASQVMKGVIEEKTNRIVEVLISSVKPFQFLLGKIIGIALVGLLQFFIWVALGFILIVSLKSFFVPDVASVPMAESVALNPGQIQMLQKIATTVDISFLLQFLGSFLFYFIAGYLLYASIFAAIGAACDNETDSQQLQTPLSIILLIGLYINLATMKSPESSIVFWGSLIPFTSPIVMLGRIPFGVPTWELLTSMGILVASFIFFTWLSGKIYRIGILMYGKKVTWKELYKWLTYNQSFK